MAYVTIRVACLPGDPWVLIWELLGRGAMVAQRTLDPFILVRIRAPQPAVFFERGAS